MSIRFRICRRDGFIEIVSEGFGVAQVPMMPNMDASYSHVGTMNRSEIGSLIYFLQKHMEEVCKINEKEIMDHRERVIKLERLILLCDKKKRKFENELYFNRARIEGLGNEDLD